MVLSGDGDFAAVVGAKVFNWLVTTAVAEFEFVCGSSECVSEDLVAEADSEYGFFAE